MAKKKDFDMTQLGNELESENPFAEGFSSEVSGMDIFGDDVPGKVKTFTKAKDIAIEKLHPSPRNPYNVVADSDEMNELKASIQKEGILNPLVVRPLDDGGYEIISGHRRRCAAELLGLKELPCYVQNLTDEEADRVMVDLNLNRENILVSEKARAVALKYEAIKKSAGRKKAGEKGEGHDSAKIIAEEMGMSDRAVNSYVRLTALAEPLMDAVDSKALPQKAGVQLSYLPEKVQLTSLAVSKAYGVAISEAVAKKIRDSVKGKAEVAEDAIAELICGKKSPEKTATKKAYKPEFKMTDKTKKKYFGSDVSDKEADQIIKKLLEDWAAEK